MMDLAAFLHPELPAEQEIVVSDRFKGADGKPVPFKVRPITQEENDKLMKAATRITKDRAGNTVRNFDSQAYSRALVVAGTVYPDFRDAELCKAYDVADPGLVPGKMLLVGEYVRLADAISNLSGLGDNMEQDAKN